MKVETTAKFQRYLKGTRRSGQRAVAKGTEPCIVWAIDAIEPKDFETEAHITVEADQVRVSVPTESHINALMEDGEKEHYHFVVTFVSGNMTPLCVSVEPLEKDLHGLVIEYTCNIPDKAMNDVKRYVQMYQQQIQHAMQ